MHHVFRFVMRVMSVQLVQLPTVALQDEACRSHTLVFRLPTAAAAAEAVQALAARGVQVDCREGYLRIGFGPNHSVHDVTALLGALRAAAQ